EPSHFVVALVRRVQGENFEDHDEQCQAHRQLREQVVEGDCEGKLNAVPKQINTHRLYLPLALYAKLFTKPPIRVCSSPAGQGRSGRSPESVTEPPGPSSPDRSHTAFPR